MKWPDDFINKVICGDCTKILPEIPDGAIDAVITDPPYGIKKADWDNEYPAGLSRKLLRWSETVIVMTGQWGLQQIIDEMGASYRGAIMGFNLNGMTFSPIGFGNWIAALICGETRKRGKDAFTFTVDGKMPPHPSPKPMDYMTKLIGTTTKPGDLILDPYAGSGSTLVAAKQLGRRYIGIEISPEYCRIAEDRLRQGELFNNTGGD